MCNWNFLFSCLAQLPLLLSLNTAKKCLPLSVLPIFASPLTLSSTVKTMYSLTSLRFLKFSFGVRLINHEHKSVYIKSLSFSPSDYACKCE